MSDEGTAPAAVPPQPGTPEFDAWLLTQSDPWVVVRAAGALDSAQRPTYLGLFRDLVAARPALEQDALLEAGKEVWHYRLGTMRKEVSVARRDVAHEVVAEQPCVVGDTWLADMIYRPGENPPVQYVVYEFATGRLSLAPTVAVPPATYRPPFSMLLTAGAVLLPSGAEEYGSDKDLLAALRAYIARYIAFQRADDPFISLLCFYTFMTWVYDRFSALPYLRAIGDFGTGKSRLLQVVGSVAYRGMLTGGATTAAPIFRAITRFRPTLVFDEADFGRSDLWDDITKILNVGYQRGTMLLRAERPAEEQQFDIMGYDCFSPKILATRRRFNDGALESRCLSRTMPLIKDLPDHIPSSLEEEFHEEAASLRNRLFLWRLRSWAHVRVDPRRRFKGVEPRVNQIVQPLLACLSPDLQTEVLSLVGELAERTASERAESLEGQVVRALVAEWEANHGPEVLGMKRVSDYLRTELGEDKVTDRKVGDIMVRVLGLRTDRHRTGRTDLVGLTYDVVARVAATYNVPLKAVEPFLPAAPSAAPTNGAVAHPPAATGPQALPPGWGRPGPQALPPGWGI